MSESKVSDWVLAIKIIIALALLYIGGWQVIWGESFLAHEMDFTYTSDALAFGHGIAIRFNDLFYGTGFINRFFYSPVISWVLFFSAWGVFASEIFSSNDSKKEK